MKRLFDKHLKATLIKDPIYHVIDGNGDHNNAIIYPQVYSNISPNVAKDMDALVGHFDYMVKESFIAEGVELCDVSTLLSEGPSSSVIDTGISSPVSIQLERDGETGYRNERLETPGLQEE